MAVQKDYLFDDLFVYQDPALYTFGTDAVLLAAFADVRRDSIGMELCAGNGVISLLLAGKKKVRSITAVELQPPCAALAVASVRDNRLDGVITVLEGDLKALPPPEKPLDFVVVNPPYRRTDSGYQSKADCRRASNCELFCTLGDVVSAAANQLKYGGDFYCCHRPDRLCDLLVALRSHDLEPKLLTLVQSRQNEAPFLLLCHAKKRSRPGMRISAPLILYTDAPGAECTPKAARIYASGSFSPKRARTTADPNKHPAAAGTNGMLAGEHRPVSPLSDGSEDMGISRE